MERHFQHELESIKTTLIKMGSVVEENFDFAIQSVPGTQRQPGTACRRYG